MYVLHTLQSDWEKISGIGSIRNQNSISFLFITQESSDMWQRAVLYTAHMYDLRIEVNFATENDVSISKFIFKYNVYV